MHEVTYELLKEKTQEVFILDLQVLETTEMDVPDEESMHIENRTQKVTVRLDDNQELRVTVTWLH